MNANSIIATNVKRLRETNGIKSEYIAFRIGISKSAYSNLENGKTEITINKLFALASFYEIGLDELLLNLNLNSMS